MSFRKQSLRPSQSLRPYPGEALGAPLSADPAWDEPLRGVKAGRVSVLAPTLPRPPLAKGATTTRHTFSREALAAASSPDARGGQQRVREGQRVRPVGTGAVRRMGSPPDRSPAASGVTLRPASPSAQPPRESSYPAGNICAAAVGRQR